MLNLPSCSCISCKIFLSGFGLKNIFENPNSYKFGLISNANIIHFIFCLNWNLLKLGILLKELLNLSTIYL